MKSLTVILTGDPSKIGDLQRGIESLASLGNYTLTDLKIKNTGFQGSDYTCLPAEFYDGKGSSLPDIIVLDKRLSITNPETELAGKNLNLRLQNNEIGFISNIDNEQYCDLVSAIGHFPLAPVYFNRFLKLITSGANGDIKVYDGDGKEKPTDLVRKIKDDILVIRGPFRAEWLGGKFGNNDITYPKVCLEDGKAVIKEVTEKLEDCLMENCFVDIKDWLNSPTPQGLVSSNTPSTQSDDFKFKCPRKGTVPWFAADSVGVYFGCDVRPWPPDSSLGGRAAKISSGN